MALRVRRPAIDPGLTFLALPWCPASSPVLSHFYVFRMEAVSGCVELGASLKLEPDVEAHLARFFASSHLAALLHALAHPPRITTLRVNELQATRSDLMTQLSAHFAPQLAQIDLSFKAHPILHDLIVLNSGERRNVQPTFPVVVVGKACGEAVLRGADVFLKGILGAANHILEGDSVSLWADVKGATLRGQVVNEPLASLVFVGNGVACANRSGLVAHGVGLGVRLTERLYEALPFNGVFSSSLYLQNLPSVLVGHVLEPQEGDVVLDMCSSPGGKSLHCASLIKNKGRIVSIDKSKSKVAVITKNAKLLGAQCIEAFLYDATRLYDPSRTNSTHPPFPGNAFDRIILDPPCSGLGNRPRFGDDMNLKNLHGYADYQHLMFNQAVELVKVGGVIVYSTCTINPDENEGVVAAVLEKHGARVKLVGVPERLQSFGQPGLPTTPLASDLLPLVRRFDPSVCDDDIGFFIAKFVKIADS